MGIGTHVQTYTIFCRFYFNKFGTNNDASWMKQDEEEDVDEDEEEDEDEDEDSLLTFYEPLRMITKLILAKFTL